MANGERRSGKCGRREGDRVNGNNSGSLRTEPCVQIEELSCGGVPLLAPASFGSDGNEHRLGHLTRGPDGEVAAFFH